MRTTEVQTRATNKISLDVGWAETPELFNKQIILISGIHGGLSISLLALITTLRVRTGPTIHRLGGDETPEANWRYRRDKTLLRKRRGLHIDYISNTTQARESEARDPNPVQLGIALARAPSVPEA